MEPVYLDCNATTPLEPEVYDKMRVFLREEYGNAGSRTHGFGNTAKKAVQAARDEVAAVVEVERDEVVFTSGATESNNIAILGLAKHGCETGRKHIITSQIEHKAVLEPVERLQAEGFECEFLPCNGNGYVKAEAVRTALRPDTLLVSIMHANNETGILQPIKEIGETLSDHECYFHVDAAQTFGKEIDALTDPRIDLISISGHKIYAPKGIGALITKRRKYKTPPLEALAVGGGQERGLRPGTLPVPLIVGLGVASRLALENHQARKQVCTAFKEALLSHLSPLKPRIHGEPERCMPHVINLSFEEVNSEALMMAVKDYVAISNGSACTSSTYTPSHVLQAMELGEEAVSGALRFSWCHMTPQPDWEGLIGEINALRS
jgi:cysteine desulfurase